MLLYLRMQIHNYRCQKWLVQHTTIIFLFCGGYWFKIYVLYCIDRENKGSDLSLSICNLYKTVSLKPVHKSS